jgi:S1-C subfamily serine protease
MSDLTSGANPPIDPGSMPGYPFSFGSMSVGEPSVASSQEVPKKRSVGFKVFLYFLIGLIVGGLIGAGGYYLGSSKSSSTVSGPLYVAANPAKSATQSSPAGPLNVQAIIAQVEPAVVTIEDQMANGIFGSSAAAGTGMIISPSGTILTNAHVVNGATSIQVNISGHGNYSAQIIGEDVSHDVAVLKVSGVNNLPTVILGDSSQVQVGDPVVAIGNALNLSGNLTVTTGIVSALNRSISTDTANLTGLIQTDTPINPGNSGGPLINAQGQVIGMNTAIASNAQNIGFAIPSNEIKSLLPPLESGSSTPGGSGAYLGVSVGDANPGAYVFSVVPNSPAQKAGIQPGDVIIGFNNQEVSGASQLAALVSSSAPGSKVTLEIERGFQLLSIQVTLGNKPSR